MAYGNCLQCGRFCGEISALVNEFRGEIVKVTGICKKHGEQDLTDQDWGWEDFDKEGK